MGDELSAPVYDPVDHEAYPPRPFAEASEGVVTFVPHDEESRANSVFVDQVVDDAGEVTLVPNQDALKEVGVLVPPHFDYVEHPDAHPEYRPPVYDEPTTVAGVPVEDLDYNTWTLAQLKTEADERELEYAGLRSKAEFVTLLTEDDAVEE